MRKRFKWLKNHFSKFSNDDIEIKDPASMAVNKQMFGGNGPFFGRNPSVSGFSGDL